MHLYHYQGPPAIAQAVAGHPQGYPIRSPADLDRWLQQTAQKINKWGLIEATFIIDRQGVLCLADRHSEHVACAGGMPVRSAGEIFFASSHNNWEVRDVSNQSTGYCPEPASWSAVAAALDQIPLPHPGAFTQLYLFRRCPDCQQLNLIKEQSFICALCGSELPQQSNLSNTTEIDNAS